MMTGYAERAHEAAETELDTASVPTVIERERERRGTGDTRRPRGDRRKWSED